MSSLLIVLAVAFVIAQVVVPLYFALAHVLVTIFHFQSVPVIDLKVSFSICKIPRWLGISCLGPWVMKIGCQLARERGGLPIG